MRAGIFRIVVVALAAIVIAGICQNSGHGRAGAESKRGRVTRSARVCDRAGAAEPFGEKPRIGRDGQLSRKRGGGLQRLSHQSALRAEQESVPGPVGADQYGRLLGWRDGVRSIHLAQYHARQQRPAGESHARWIHRPHADRRRPASFASAVGSVAAGDAVARPPEHVGPRSRSHLQLFVSNPVRRGRPRPAGESLPVGMFGMW